MIVKKVSFDEIRKMKFKAEPHTVDLRNDKPNSDWWVLAEEGKFLCVICTVARRNEIHFARTFTPQEYRGNGYCTLLLQYLSDVVFCGQRLTAHCLQSSIGCYSRSGFKLKAIKEFKHGRFYYMERSVS